jgi:hypothetical protein
MKKLLLAFAFILSISNVKASHLSSELSLELSKPGDYTIIIDEVAYHKIYKSLFIPAIEPGLHHIKTIKNIHHGRYGYAKKVVICDRYVKIHANTHVDAIINHYNDFIITNKHALIQEPVLNKPVCLNSSHACGYESCHLNDLHLGYGEFQQLINAIENKIYASDKKSIAMMAIDKNILSASQVAQLVSLMPFESDKVDIAKAAYHKTINKEDYYLVNKEFNYNSSISELGFYIYAHR